ncbi:short-chain dehydrogenase [Virgisporangium aliadipatigenens]|uniref:Short-chain dehydrogenase n=1 Tax=Virgisporangium aliadipatigenens TaxID=741659 RepID=A0A8J3YLX9_9ACTN|nr:SDR family NAD(P)-dependent oxidoreductase [Virgisporangium aliadipatigenens]GIJ46533.1 short-chain dehydrogenase [Virgisporangium aliadipatigenens]
MTKWTAENLPELHGRTVLITGAGRGIGLVAARAFGRAGAHVVLAVRDPSRVPALTGSFAVRQLDVADLGSVRRFAAGWEGPLDVLVNNAGVMDIPAARTADGLDLQTATNYTGPFALTNLLLPHVTDRVVHVTSGLHRQSTLDIGDLDWRSRKYNGMRAYRDSKLALVLFSLELQRRLADPVRSILADPGIVPTRLAAHSRANVVNRFRFLLNDPERGALPILYAATQDVPGNAYVAPDGLGGIRGYPVLRSASRAGLDGGAARELWAATAALTGVGR